MHADDIVINAAHEYLSDYCEVIKYDLELFLKINSREKVSRHVTNTIFSVKL